MAREIQSIVCLRGGVTAFEKYASPYARDDLRALYSLTKSFASAGFGIAEREGLVDRRDFVYPRLDLTPPGEHARQMRFSDLLSMRMGYAQEDISYFDYPDWLARISAAEPEFVPGEVFAYDNRAPYYASAAIQRASGETLHQYIMSRLLKPLGIEKSGWSTSPEGINPGGYGLKLRTRDVAAFGQALLSGGLGIIPENYLRDAVTLRAAFPKAVRAAHQWSVGYGYWFWISREPGTFVGSGSMGQLLIVRPARDEVIAVNSGCLDGSLVYSLATGESLPEPEDILPPSGRGLSAPARRFALRANPLGITRVSIDASDDITRVTFETPRYSICMNARLGAFEDNVFNIEEDGAGFPCLGDFYNRARIAGAWRGSELRLIAVYQETPYRDDMRVSINAGEISINIERTPGIERLRPTKYELVGKEVAV